MAKINSRWRKGAQRYSTERTVDVVSHARQADGKRRREVDSLTEVRFCERTHEQPGWRKGARIRKRGN